MKDKDKKVQNNINININTESKKGKRKKKTKRGKKKGTKVNVTNPTRLDVAGRTIQGRNEYTIQPPAYPSAIPVNNPSYIQYIPVQPPTFNPPNKIPSMFKPTEDRNTFLPANDYYSRLDELRKMTETGFKGVAQKFADLATKNDATQTIDHDDIDDLSGIDDNDDTTRYSPIIQSEETFDIDQSRELPAIDYTVNDDVDGSDVNLPVTVEDVEEEDDNEYDYSYSIGGVDWTTNQINAAKIQSLRKIIEDLGLNFKSRSIDKLRDAIFAHLNELPES